jgi:integrase
MPSGACVVRYEGKRGVVWRVKYLDAAGRQVKETIGAERDGVTRKQAEAELRERLVRVERKGYRKPQTITFGEYATKWFAEGPARRRWKLGTIRKYVFVERRLVATFGPMPLMSIRPEHIDAFVAESTGGASTIACDLSILHAIFTTARIDPNPAARVERPKQPRRKWRLLEPAEVPAVCKAFSDVRARRVFLTLALTGLRRCEVVQLRWRDLNLLEGTLRVVESKSEEGERLIALPPTLTRELADHFAGSRYNADSDYVFAHPTRGTPLETSRWYPNEFRKALAEAGITDYIRPHHDMRHTALTNLAAVGASGPSIMATAGHKSYSTTKRYIDLAGVVFRDESNALERRLLGVQSGTDLSTSQPLSADPGLSETPVAASS